MNDKRRVAASEMITRLCDELNYSRGHVANFVRRHREQLKAVRQGRRWRLPPESEAVLRALIIAGSGKRYKNGEKGPRA